MPGLQPENYKYNILWSYLVFCDESFFSHYFMRSVQAFRLNFSTLYLRMLS